MRIKETKVYQYDELSDKAKEKARDWFREDSSGDEWWESTYEDAKNVGLKISHFDIDRGNKIGIEFTGSARETAEKILKDHGLACETHRLAAAFLVDWEKNNESEEEDRADGLLDNFIWELGEEYLSILRREYEFQNSDETVEENIRANEFEFEENGNRA